MTESSDRLQWRRQFVFLTRCDPTAETYNRSCLCPHRWQLLLVLTWTYFPRFFFSTKVQIWISFATSRLPLTSSFCSGVAQAVMCTIDRLQFAHSEFGRRRRLHSSAGEEETLVGLHCVPVVSSSSGDALSLPIYSHSVLWVQWTTLCSCIKKPGFLYFPLGTNLMRSQDLTDIPTL